MNLQDVEYTAFVETSEVVHQFYKNQQILKIKGKHKNQRATFLKSKIGLIKNAKRFYIFKSQKQDNTPLIINAEKGQFTYQLLVQWQDFHRLNDKKKNKDIIISHYARTSEKNSNIFYAIYRILVQLKEINQINLKVELKEQKLRKYFGYWLDACSSYLDGQIVNDSQIIIILDGIDFFRDFQQRKEAVTAFWMPKTIPFRIKFIITSYGKTDAIQYFKQYDCKTLKICDSLELSYDVIKYLSNEKNQYVSDETKQKFIQILHSMPKSILISNEFVKLFISTFIPYETQEISILKEIKNQKIEQICQKHKIEQIQKFQNIEELYIYIFEFFQAQIMKPEKFKKLIITLVIIQKGLSTKEILELIDIKKEEFAYFIAFFKFNIIQSQNIWLTINEQFKLCIKEFYQPDNQYLKNLHTEIATILENQQMTFQNLEEQIYHLNASKQYFKLKEKISNIENFLLMYNSQFKYDLCRYWQKLEETGFDPVMEYQKSIEMFEGHYKLKSDELLFILLQFSRFFKDFSDFETGSTPDFRHPPIKGGPELEQIGLLGELKNLKMNSDENQEVQILNEVESLNIEIPSNKDQVREHYKQQIRDRMVKATEEEDEEQTQQLVNDLEQTKTQNQNSDDEFEVPVIRQEKKNIRNKKDKKNKDYLKGIPLMPLSQLNEMEPTYYYYKRWVWLIFPWACMNQKESCNFSEIMKKSNLNSTQSMNYLDEIFAELQALIITLDAKMKKKIMYCTENQLSFEINTLNKLRQILQEMEVSLQKNKLEDINMNNFDNYQQPDKKRSSMFRSQPPKKEDMFKSQYKQMQQSQTPTQANAQQQKKQLFGNQTDRYENNTLFFTEPQDTTYNRKNLVMNTMSQLPNLIRQSQSIFLGALNKNKTVKSQQLEKTQKKNNYKTDNKIYHALPKLKNDLGQHSQIQIDNLKKQNSVSKQRMDELRFKNQQLTERLQHFQKIEEQGPNKEKTEQILNDVTQLEDRLVQTENSLQQNEKQIVHMNKIMMVCKGNDKQNQEWIKNLNFFAMNQKKLIYHEKNQVKINIANISKLEKLQDKFQMECDSNLQMHDNFIKEINSTIQQKFNFDNQLTKTSKIIDQSIEQSKTCDDFFEKMKAKQQKNQNQKKIKEDKQNQNTGIKDQIMAQQKQQIQKISELLKLDVLKEDFTKSEEFIKFMNNYSKNNELHAILNSLNDKKSLMEKQLESKRIKFGYLQKANFQTKFIELNQQYGDEIDEDIIKNQINDSVKLHNEIQQSVKKYQDILLSITMNLNQMIKSTYDQNSSNYVIKDMIQFDYKHFNEEINQKISFLKSQGGDKLVRELLNSNKKDYREFEVKFRNYQNS